MQKRQILEQIAVLFRDDSIAPRDRLVAGQILLKEADNTAVGIEQRAEDALSRLLSEPEHELQPSVLPIEAVVEVGQEAKLLDLLDMIDPEIKDATNLNKLAADLLARGWITRKVNGVKLWKRQFDLPS